MPCKFKAGDEVECIDDSEATSWMRKGLRFRIADVAWDNHVRLKNSVHWWHEGRFIPVTSATPVPAPGTTTNSLGDNTKEVGIKYDSGKLQFRLVDPAFYRDMVAVLTLGAKKYAPDNWLRVAPERYEDALERHWNQWRCGESQDGESKLSHLVHVAVNAMFLWAHERKNAPK